MEHTVNPYYGPEYVPAFPVTYSDIGREVRIYGFDEIYGGTNSMIIEKVLHHKGFTTGEAINKLDSNWRILYDLKNKDRLYRFGFIRIDKLKRSNGNYLTGVYLTDIRQPEKPGLNYLAQIDCVISEPDKPEIRFCYNLKYDLIELNDELVFQISDIALTIYSENDDLTVLEEPDGKYKLIYYKREPEYIEPGDFYLDPLDVFPTFKISQDGVSFISYCGDIVKLKIDLPVLLDVLLREYTTFKGRIRDGVHTKRSHSVELANRSIPDWLKGSFTQSVS